MVIWGLVVATNLFWLVAGAGLSGTITVLALFLVLPFVVIFVDRSWWFAWGLLPAEGDTVAPMWPYPADESTWSAVLMTLLGAARLIPGVPLALRERRKVA
ncbi:hypothetical protein A4R43_33715 [Amycolatopsis albispora]|uniref:Uncharacterized protein n=1 Tax=Amycolatopsis albispora TaxID=1804986 RepID=A0A344LFG7_9PSEU|nr:hypothetical protein A4R43_33715 [Amycolatopsis albispora]